MQHPGMIGADGRSILPPGIVDFSEQKHSYTPEQEERIAALMSGLGVDQVKAKYKLEVMFTEPRSFHKPFMGVVSAWSNGGHFNGGGDEAVYFCPTETSPGKFCSAPVSIKFISGRDAVCERCRQAHKAMDLVGQFPARLPFQFWAKTLTAMFRILGGDADLRIGIMSGDIRRATLEKASFDRGEALTKLRTERKWVVYPLASLIRDTSTGSDVESRIRAFISA